MLFHHSYFHSIAVSPITFFLFQNVSFHDSVVSANHIPLPSRQAQLLPVGSNWLQQSNIFILLLSRVVCLSLRLQANLAR